MGYASQLWDHGANDQRVRGKGRFINSLLHFVPCEIDGFKGARNAIIGTYRIVLYRSQAREMDEERSKLVSVKSLEIKISVDSIILYQFPKSTKKLSYFT